MSQAYTAVVKQDGERWFGWIEEVPGVNCQERSATSCSNLFASPLGKRWR